MTTIRLRRDTAANWTADDPILALAEPGFESDTDKLKIGDGITDWNNLPYYLFGPDQSSDVNITAWGLSASFLLTGSEVYDATYGTLTSAHIQWPDGVTGTYTATLDSSSTNPGGVTHFVATYVGLLGTKTLTVTIPRDSDGNVSGTMTAVIT